MLGPLWRILWVSYDVSLYSMSTRLGFHYNASPETSKAACASVSNVR